MEVRVPQLAEGVQAGTVVSLLVKEGDAVKKDQNLLELESNKAVASIAAPSEGRVSRIVVKEGDEVPVGGLLVVLDANGSASAAPKTGPSAAASATPAKSVQTSAPVQSGAYHYESKAGFPPPASPTVRKVAAELGMDLGRIRGSEHGGRIVMADLKAYIQALQAGALVPAPAAGAAPATRPAAAPSVDFSKWGPVTRKKMSALRKTISAQMLASWTHTPRVTQFDEVTIDGVLVVRKAFVEEYKKQGVSLTITPFILKALVATLKRHPILNASMDEAAGEIVYKDYYHIGIAVDTEQGLIVPVLRDVDKKNIFQLCVELSELAQKARDRKVAMEDLQGATFSISNQGMIGGTHFTPIINKPEVAILGIGRGGPKPVVQGKKIAIENRMPIALSYDHRVIDGGQAARFVVDFGEALKHLSIADVRLQEAKKTSAQKPATQKAGKPKGKK